MCKQACCLVLICCFVLTAALVRAQVAPDATTVGPFTTTSSEYKLPASIDPDVATELATELWARVYRPVDLSGAPFPLLVFLHGNHATCGRFEGAGPGRFDINVQYTFTGTCPPGFVVVPSHAGYAYLADRLASWGYIVVSINANRGVNAAPGVFDDRGLNLRRGRLVLKHLQRLSEWNAAGGAPASIGFDVRARWILRTSACLATRGAARASVPRTTCIGILAVRGRPESGPWGSKASSRSVPWTARPPAS